MVGILGLLVLLLVSSVSAQSSREISQKLAAFLSKVPETDSSLLQLLQGHQTVTTSIGRRRTVNDVDCDEVTAPIDSIEDACNANRWSVFQDLEGQIMNTSYININNTNLLGKLNVSLGGDTLNALGPIGIRVVFEEQRAKLYGLNGTCLEPQRMSLAHDADDLFNAVFAITNNISAVYDTHWTNLVTIQQNVSNAFADSIANFVNKSTTVLDQTNAGAKQLGTYGASTGSDFVNDRNLNITTLANKINSNERLVLGNFTTLSDNFDAVRTAESSTISNTLDQLDDLAGMFADTNNIVSAQINSLSTQVQPLITAPPNKIAQQFMVPVTQKGNLVIESFKNDSAADLASANVTWMQTLAQGNFDLNTKQTTEWKKYSNATNFLDQKFNDTGSSIDAATGTAISNSTTLLSSAQESSLDAKNIVKQVSSQADVAGSGMQQVMESSSSQTQDQLNQLRTQIASILGKSSDLTDNQLSAIANQLSTMGINLSSLQNQSGAKLQSVLGSLVGSVAHTGAARSNGISDTTGSLISTDQWASSLVNTHGDFQNSVIKGTMTPLLSSTSASGIYTMSSGHSANVSSSQYDAQSALGALADTVSGSVTGTDVTGKLVASDLLSLLSGNGTALVNATGQAGVQMSGASSALSANLNKVGQTAEGVYQLSQSAGNALSQQFSQLAALSDASGDLFSQQSGSVTSATADGIAATENGITSAMDQTTSAVGRQLAGIQNSVDGTTTAGINSNAAAENSQDAAYGVLNFVNAGMNSSLGSVADVGVSGQSQVSGSIAGLAQKGLNTVGSIGNQMASKLAASQSSAQNSLSGLLNNLLTKFNQTSGSLMAVMASGGQSSVAPLVLQGSATIDAETQKYTLSADSVISQLSDSTNKLPQTVADVAELNGPVESQFASIQSDMERNYSSYASAAGGLISVLPSNFPDGIDGALSLIIEQQDEAAGLIANGASGVNAAATTAASTAATSGASVLDSLDQSTNDWQNQFNQAHDSAMSASQTRVDGLSSVADQADALAGNIAVFQKTAAGSNNSLFSDTSPVTSLLTTMNSALAVANGTLTRGAGSSQTLTQFNTQIDSSRNSQLVAQVSGQTNATQSATAAASAALGSAEQQGVFDLHSMQTALAADEQDRQSRLASALSLLASNRTSVQSNISSNSDATQIQLMLAKRATGQLLTSWGKYVDAETDKFSKMKSFDEEYVTMTANNIDSSRSSLDGKLTDSEDTLSQVATHSVDSVSDFAAFKNTTLSTISSVGTIIPILNQTTTSSVQQLSELFASFDKSDEDVDVQARNSSLSAIAEFEAGLDQHAQMAVSAARGNLIPALIGGQ